MSLRRAYCAQHTSYIRNTLRRCNGERLRNSSHLKIASRWYFGSTSSRSAATKSCNVCLLLSLRVSGSSSGYIVEKNCSRKSCECFCKWLRSQRKHISGMVVFPARCENMSRPARKGLESCNLDLYHCPFPDVPMKANHR